MKLKKVLALILMGILISIPVQARGFGGKRGGGGDLKEILRLLKSIDAASGGQGTATLAEIETKLQMIQQTKMQIEQLKMEVENFKQLGKDLANFDLRSLNNLVDRTVGFKDYATMTTKEMEKELDGFFSEYEKNPEKYKIIDKVDIQTLKNQRKKLRENQGSMQKAIYNNMAKNQMYASIKDQGEDLKRKINTLNNVEGTLQAIQAVGGLLEQTNQILLETKQMIATNSEMRDRIEAKAEKEEQVKNDNLDAAEKENEDIRNKVKNDYESGRKKSKFKISF